MKISLANFGSITGEKNMKWNALALSCAVTACAGGVAAPNKPVVSSVASPRAPLASYRTF